MGERSTEKEYCYKGYCYSTNGESDQIDVAQLEKGQKRKQLAYLPLDAGGAHRDRRATVDLPRPDREYLDKYPYSVGGSRGNSWIGRCPISETYKYYQWLDHAFASTLKA